MRIKLWGLMVCMVIGLNACVESEKDMEQYVEQVKSTAKSKVEPIPPAAVVKNVDYTAESMRSPFVLTGGQYVNTPEIITGPSGETIHQAPRPDLDRPREYLEQFPLTTLEMVGTLSKPHMNWGLVKDANGMIHAVKVGDYMGQNSGEIVAITPDQIKLNELVPNGAGGWMESRAELTLILATPEASSAQSATTAAPTKPGTAKDAAGAKPVISKPQVQIKSGTGATGAAGPAGGAGTAGSRGIGVRGAGAGLGG